VKLKAFMANTLDKAEMILYRIFHLYLDQEKTSRPHDELLNNLLDKVEEDPSLITIDSHKRGDQVYTVRICGVEYWVANFPYSFGNVYSSGQKPLLPRIKTRWRFKNILLSTLILTQTHDSIVLDLVSLKRKGDGFFF
jgi:hypothetical protein